MYGPNPQPAPHKSQRPTALECVLMALAIAALIGLLWGWKRTDEGKARPIFHEEKEKTGQAIWIGKDGR